MEEKPQSARSNGGEGRRRGAVGLEDSKPRDRHMIPVWFFVGVILLFSGLVILATGVYEFSSPPPTVLASLHPALWWGALLTLIGGIYVYFYLPKKS
jgi:FtsH-binding integral membrane protein